MRSLPARLPVLVRPAHQETLASYVARLATLNTVTYPLLWGHLSAKDGRTTRRLIVTDRLAAATGRRVDDLQRAFLELRDPEPDWRRYRHLPQPGCPTCTGSHPGGTVHHLLRHHEYLCAQHGYWSGPPTYTEDMTPDRLSTLIPELTAAQREHDRLVRRHGWLQVFHAFDTSLTMCLEQRSTDTTPRHVDRWAGRLATLMPPSPAGFSNSRFIAAFYPEIIQLTALFCSPRWQDVARLAMTSAQHLQAITAQINAVLGRPHDVPAPQHGPIRWWIQTATENTPTVPAHTFIHTRRSTLDGIPASRDRPSRKRAEASHLRQIAAEYDRHQHVPTWMLIRNGHRPIQSHPAVR